VCCFAGAVENVADTKIFARPTGDGSQFLVYEMTYKSQQPTAMILPLPTELPAREGSVRFISLDGYREFFVDLTSAFPSVAGLGCGSDGSLAHKSDLRVHEVGDYIASFVPSIDDFTKLDPQFTIPKSTWEKIPRYFDYGFAVFQLKELSGRPHPMAFEFTSRWDDRVFFPTVHIHDGEVHTHDHFDHMLFLQHAGFDSVVGRYVEAFATDRETGFIRSKEPVAKSSNIDKANGILEPKLLVHRLDLQGSLPNEDQVFAIAGDPTKPRLNLRSLRGLLPWGLGFAAFAWFIARRRRLRRRQVAIR
jgi:hypothetical protein